MEIVHNMDITLKTVYNFIHALTEEKFKFILKEFDFWYYTYHHKLISNYIYDILIEVYQKKYSKIYIPLKGVSFLSYTINNNTISWNTYNYLKLNDRIDGVPITIHYYKENTTINYCIYIGNMVKRNVDAIKMMDFLNFTPIFPFSNNKENEIIVNGIIPSEEITTNNSSEIYGSQKHLFDYYIETNTISKNEIFWYVTSITIDDNTYLDNYTIQKYGFNPIYSIHVNKKENQDIIIPIIYDLRKESAVYALSGFIVHDDKTILGNCMPIKHTQEIVVSNVVWKNEKHTSGILRPKINYNINGIRYISNITAKQVIDLHIGKGSVLLTSIPKIKKITTNSISKLNVYCSITPCSSKNVYPCKRKYGDYNWNKKNTQFIIEKTEFDTIYIKIKQFCSLFQIKNSNMNAILKSGYIEKGIIKTFYDLFLWDPIKVYYKCPEIDKNKTFYVYETLKKTFKKVPLYKFLILSRLWNISENLVFETLERYPEFYNSNQLQSKKDEYHDKYYKLYTLLHKKRDLFYKFLKNINPLSIIKDSFITIDYTLYLTGQYVAFYKFPSKKKENVIKSLNGIYQTTPDDKTTLIIVPFQEFNKIKEIKSQYRSDLLFITDSTFTAYYYS